MCVLASLKFSYVQNIVKSHSSHIASNLETSAYILIAVKDRDVVQWRNNK